MSKETLQNALIKKTQQIEKSTELLLSKTRDWQVIKNYLCNRLADIELTPAQQEKMKRYQYIYEQLASGKYSDTDVINQVKKIYKIEVVQAYEDMSCTREIFTTVLSINKRFEIKIQLEINRNMMRKAEEMNDYRAAAQLEKNRALLLKLVPDEEETPGEFFEGHEIDAVFDPRLLGAPDVNMKELLNMINEKRKVKINSDLISDIDFENVPTNAKDTPL
jgi:hypothetical protein